MDFIENLKMTDKVGGGSRWSCYLLHYDALRRKIDMQLTPYALTLSKLLKKRSLTIIIKTGSQLISP